MTERPRDDIDSDDDDFLDQPFSSFDPDHDEPLSVRIGATSIAVIDDRAQHGIALNAHTAGNAPAADTQVSLFMRPLSVQETSFSANALVPASTGAGNRSAPI